MCGRLTCFICHELNSIQILMQTQRHEPIVCINLSSRCVTLISSKMEEYIRISTVLEFFERHRCIVFVTARATCAEYMSHFALSTCFFYYLSTPCSMRNFYSHPVS